LRLHAVDEVRGKLPIVLKDVPQKFFVLGHGQVHLLRRYVVDALCRSCDTPKVENTTEFIIKEHIKEINNNTEGKERRKEKRKR
jgi:hypothetical protein